MAHLGPKGRMLMDEMKERAVNESAEVQSDT